MRAEEGADLLSLEETELAEFLEAELSAFEVEGEGVEEGEEAAEGEGEAEGEAMGVGERDWEREKGGEVASEEKREREGERERENAGERVGVGGGQGEDEGDGGKEDGDNGGTPNAMSSMDPKREHRVKVAEASRKVEAPEARRLRRKLSESSGGKRSSRSPIFSGSFGKLPTELFPHILKYLCPEDLSACSKTCQFLRAASGEENLWRRLYCLRWGAPRGRPRGVTWKQFYFDRDRADMAEFVRNSPEEFREYFVHMQAAKRSQAPRPEQLFDDVVVVESSLAQEIATWRHRRRLPEVPSGRHVCNGAVCAFHRMGDVYLCEETGRAHVCDENCTETLSDPENQLLVCSISGRCFDRLLSPEEEDDDGEQAQVATAVAEEAEPLMGAGRLGRAYCLGYNCDDEDELLAAQRAMGCY